MSVNWLCVCVCTVWHLSKQSWKCSWKFEFSDCNTFALHICASQRRVFENWKMWLSGTLKSSIFSLDFEYCSGLGKTSKIWVCACLHVCMQVRFCRSLQCVWLYRSTACMWRRLMICRTKRMKMRGLLSDSIRLYRQVMSVYACVFGSIDFLHDSRGNPPDPFLWIFVKTVSTFLFWKFC